MKTKIVEVPQVRSWLLDSAFIYRDKILLTSVLLNDSTVGVASDFTIWPVNGNNINTPSDGIIVDRVPLFFFHPPTLDKKLGVTLTDSTHLRVFSTTSPYPDMSSFIFTPPYSNSNIADKWFPIFYPPYKGYPIINSKYVLVPFETNNQEQKCYLSLLKVDQSVVSPGDSINVAVTLSSAKTITLTPEPSTSGFSEYDYTSQAFFNKFFVYLNDQFFRIDTAGNVKAFGNSPAAPVTTGGAIVQMFTLDNYLFAINGAKFFISQDQGETWSLFLYAPGGTIYGSLTYQNIGKELYAFFGSQIFRVTISGSTLKYQELDNDGLQTSQISSINKAGKYAFVTTLSGLYYRDTTNFNNPKK